MNLMDGEGNANVTQSPTHAANADTNNNNTTTTTSQSDPSHGVPIQETKRRRSFNQDGGYMSSQEPLAQLGYGWKVLKSIFQYLLIASNFWLMRQMQRRRFLMSYLRLKACLEGKGSELVD